MGINADTLKELKHVMDMVESAKKQLGKYTEAKEETLNARTDDLENAICEQSEDIENALADIEVALCDLSEEGE